jgi:hypothetical protein
LHPDVVFVISAYAHNSLEDVYSIPQSAKKEEGFLDPLPSSGDEPKDYYTTPIITQKKKRKKKVWGRNGASHYTIPLSSSSSLLEVVLS